MAQNIPPILFETILTYGKQWWIALVQLHGWRSWCFVKWYFWSVLSGRCSGSFLWGNENGGVWQKDSSGLSQQMAVFNGKSKSRNFRNFQKLFLYAYLIGLKLNLALPWYNFLTTIGLSDIAYYHSSTFQHLRALSKVMKECWYETSEARLTALRIKKTVATAVTPSEKLLP